MRARGANTEATVGSVWGASMCAPKMRVPGAVQRETLHRRPGTPVDKRKLDPGSAVHRFAYARAAPRPGNGRSASLRALSQFRAFHRALRSLPRRAIEMIEKFAKHVEMIARLHFA